jgi:hypothetical protein
MEEIDPEAQKPVNDHPDSVRHIDDEAPAPRKYELPADYHKNKSKLGRYIVTAFIILLVAAAVYWLLLKPKPAKAPTTANTSKSNSAQTSEAKVDTEHYDSPNFNLGFDYPKGWKVSDISGSGKLTVTSTPTKLKGLNESFDGQIVMTIRDKTQKLTEFDKGDATSIIGSEKINYTKPSETQRGSTYISFLNYASSKDPQLDGIYITGDAGYEKQQNVPSTDIAKSDPVINVTFVKCSDSKCAGTATAAGVAAEEWETNTAFSKPIKTMLESLAIQ